MFGGIFRRKPKEREVRKRPGKRKSELSGLGKKLDNLSTKEDVERIIKEVAASRDAVISEVGKIPDSVSSILADQITSPIKDFISSELEHREPRQLSINQAVKQEDVKQLSSNQAVKQKRSIEEVVGEMRQKLEMLSQRHLKVLNVLVQNRDSWLDYEEIGRECSPQLTGSCIRGYVADLINSYSIPIVKKNFGRKSKVRVSDKAIKHLAITKLVD